MNQLLFSVLMLVTSLHVSAQEGIIRLQCDGKYSSYVLNMRDLEIKGGYVEIRKDWVKVVGITGFSGPDGIIYQVTKENEAVICFTFSKDDRYKGCLNRFSGKIDLSQMATNQINKVDQIYFGDCRPTSPLF